MRTVLAALIPSLMLATTAVLPAAAAELTQFGVWYTQDHEGAFDIYPCGDGGLCGRLVWMADERPDPGTEGPPRDRHNPDPAKRGHTVCGLEMLTGFHRDPDGAWSGGRIYDPEDGQFYRARIEVRGPFTLGLRGYILVPLLGQTQIWTRVPPDFTARCHQG